MTVTAPPPAAMKLPCDDWAAGFLRLESVDAAQNRFRFYTISWQKTLWGEWTIRSTWGRLGSMGRSHVTYFETEGALRETLPKVLARRRGRGYGVP